MNLEDAIKERRAFRSLELTGITNKLIIDLAKQPRPMKLGETQRPPRKDLGAFVYLNNYKKKLE